MNTSNGVNNQDLNQPVTKGYLGEFMEQTLLPAISSMMDEKIKPVRDDIAVLAMKINSHLELSDKRYLELKGRDTLIAKWLKQIADKTGVNIDLAELEKF